jgi:hypothetical protein
VMLDHSVPTWLSQSRRNSEEFDLVSPDGSIVGEEKTTQWSAGSRCQRSDP